MGPPAADDISCYIHLTTHRVSRSAEHLIVAADTQFVIYGVVLFAPPTVRILPATTAMPFYIMIWYITVSTAAYDTSW